MTGKEGGGGGGGGGGGKEEEVQLLELGVNPNTVTHSFLVLLLAVSWASFPSRLRIFRESILAVSLLCTLHELVQMSGGQEE